MAQNVQPLFIDDIDGSAAEGTVRFGLDGAEYEIDLNLKHAEALRTSLGQYVTAARRTPAAPRPGRSPRRPAASGPGNTEARAWAKPQGTGVKDRGRIPAELIVKFKTAAG